MTSGNVGETTSQPADAASGNTDRRDTDTTAPLPLEYAAALAGYQRSLRGAPLAAPTRAKYVSRVRGYLTWLGSSARDVDTDGNPLDEPGARDGAVRDWRAWAKTVGRLRPATINNTLAAIDDFYTRRGLGPAAARREALPRRAPKALSNREVVRYLRAVEHRGNARDAVVALLLADRPLDLLVDGDQGFPLHLVVEVPQVGRGVGVGVQRVLDRDPAPEPVVLVKSMLST